VSWLELPRSVDAVDLYRRALAAGISIAPGTLFSAREKYRHFVRLSFAYGSEAAVARALATVGELASAAATPAPPRFSASRATPRGRTRKRRAPAS
jgi:DNA-binding transcriptional MocR family regulator